MAPRLTLKDLYGERGAQRFTRQRNPQAVLNQQIYPNGQTSEDCCSEGPAPQAKPFVRVPGQPIPGGYGYGSHYGDQPSSVFDPALAVAKVTAAYAAGGVVLSMPNPNILLGMAGGQYNWVAEGYRLQSTVQKVYLALGKSIWDWAIKYKGWAAAGKRDDGSSYSWGQWYEHGKTLLDSIVYQAGVYVDPTIGTAFVDAIKATGQQLLSPSKWPWWMQLAAVGGAAFVALKLASAAGGAKQAFLGFPQLPGYRRKSKKR
jgi:hypothetical protein